MSSSDKTSALLELLGSESSTARLDCEMLQKNSKRSNRQNGDKDEVDKGRSALEDGPRLPTAIATVPEQGLLVVGFDSGEVQCYSGLPGELKVGSGFRVSHGDPVRLVRTLEKHVTLDSDLEKDEDDCRAVFYVSCGSDVILWLTVDGEVRFPWIRYIPTPEAKYQITDALLCPGMPKMVAATSTGKLLLYGGRPPKGWKYKASEDQAKSTKGGTTQKYKEDGMGETHKAEIVKVAHEGAINCLATNIGGDLLLSGGADGMIALWQWGKDQFLHQVASLFITNIPIRSAFFMTDIDCDHPRIGEEVELALTLDSHVMGVIATRKSRQAFRMEQRPDRHFAMPRQGGRVTHQRGFQRLFHPESSKADLFLVLRSFSRCLEVVGPDGVSVSATSQGCTCFDHREGAKAMYEDGQNGGQEVKGQVVTAAAMVDAEGKPEVKVWVKEL